MNEANEESGSQPTFDPELREGLVRAMKGEAELKDLLDVDEYFLKSVEQKAYSLYASGRYHTAEALLDGVTSIDPDRTYANVLLGDIALRTEQFEKARHYLGIAYQADSEDACTALKWAETLLRLEAVDEGLEVLRGVPSLADDDDPHVQRARLLLKQHDAGGEHDARVAE